MHLSMLSCSYFNSKPHNILSKPLFHITILETKDSGESGKNPVAMTVTNPRKENWPSRVSNQRPPILNPQRYRLSYGARHGLCGIKGLRRDTTMTHMKLTY